MDFFRWLCCGKQQNIRNDVFSGIVLCKYLLVSQNFTIKIFNEHFHLFCSTSNVKKFFSYRKLANIHMFQQKKQSASMRIKLGCKHRLTKMLRLSTKTSKPSETHYISMRGRKCIDKIKTLATASQ